MRWQALPLIVVLAACKGGGGADTDKDGAVPDGGDADTDADSDADADCSATISGITPADGDDQVRVDAEITATFSEAVTEANRFEIEVDSAEGTTALASDGLSMTWTGTLEPGTNYVVTASVCDSSSVSGFTTLPAGLDLESLSGNTYVLPWNTIDITEPADPLNVLGGIITVEFVLAQILSVDTDSLLADAVGTIGARDVAGNPYPDCDLAVLQTADFSLNPYFQILGTIAIPIDSDGNTTDVEDFSLTARMADDGSAITDVELSGMIATEEILPNEDCENGVLIQALLPTCVPCTASDTGKCMLFTGTAPRAQLRPEADIAGFCGL